MAYYNKKILTDIDKKPIPQYYNPVTDSFEPLQGYNGANSFHEQGTIIVDMWSGNSNITKPLSKPCQVFSIVNDGESDINVTVGAFNFVVKADEAFEGKFPLFNAVTLTTTSEYRAYVKE